MIRRHLTEQLFQALGDTPAVLINGARQTGKSTLAQLPELWKARGWHLTR
jgi:predicted AAA+ superfamily ATPase